MTLRVAAIDSIILCSTVHGALASCLPGAISPQQRQSISALDGEHQVPFGLWVHDWDSAWLASYVVKILAEEVLGYNTVISGVGSSSNSGLYATAGCRSPNSFASDPECGEDQIFTHHATMEVWGVSKIATMRQKLAKWPELLPEDAGDMGYAGIQGTYVFEPQRALAFQNEGLALEYYRSYDANWTQPWGYFDNFTAFDRSDLKPCNETWFTETEMMRVYLEVTGDRQGLVDMGDGTFVARCWHDSWWFAPACRNSPERCVPFVTTYLGWFMHDFMQRAAHFNMPLALAVAKSDHQWKLVARQRRCLTYWWEPDLTFIDLHPSIITFPAYNALERAQNIRLSMSDDTRLSKWVHNRLGLKASRLREFIFRFSITMLSINEMLLENARGVPHEQVACQWVAANENIWRTWIPSKTDCLPGKGLVSKDGSFVGSRSLADDCEWCPPGRFAVQHSDDISTTYVCIECSAGSSQPNPGQLECSQCGPGTFAATSASRECGRCPLGTYQNGTSSSRCQECPAPMTTVVLGAVAISECICPEHKFRPLGSDLPRPCEDCPRGMHCDVGSTEENIPRLSGALAGGEHPKPLPLYFARRSDPLSVYMCTSHELCPGGGFDACSEQSYGLACGKCIAGYHRTRSGCRKCSSLSQSSWLLPGLLLLLGPFLVCLLHSKSQDPVHKWGSPQNAIAASGFLTLIYLQIIATVRTCYLFYPPVLENSVGWTSYTLDLLASLQPDCSVASDFKLNFVLQLLTPIYALVVFVTTFVCSRVGEKLLRRARFHMDGHIMMACYGSVYNTFFIGIAAHSFTLFQCYEHPNGQRSLRSAPDVLCDSQIWHDLLVVAVVAVLVFCVGALTVFTYINFKAPAHFHDANFRRQWRFLFMRFRPTVWWWGTCLLLKGVWVNLTTVLFETGHLQLVWLMCAHMLYLLVCFMLLPWRSMSVSALDVGMHAMIMLFFSLLPHFVVDRDGQGSLLNEVVEEQKGLRGVVGLSIACFVAPFLGAFGVLCVQLWSHFRPTTDKQHEAQAKQLRAVLGKVTNVEDMACVLEMLPTADMLTLEATRRMLHAELLSDYGARTASVRRKRLTSFNATGRGSAASRASTVGSPGSPELRWESSEQPPPWLLSPTSGMELKMSVQPRATAFAV